MSGVLTFKMAQRQGDSHLGKENNYKDELWTIKSDGSENKVLISEGNGGWYQDIQIMPNGKAILFTADLTKEYNYQVYSKQLSGDGDIVQLTHHPKYAHLAAVSPSGEDILYTALPVNQAGGGGNCEIYKMSIKSKEPVLIGKNY